MISLEEKRKIIQILNEKGVKNTCPMCGNLNFIITDGYFANYISDNFSNITIGGSAVPSISIICSKCGFISQHSLGILGLLNNNTTINKTEENINNTTEKIDKQDNNK